MTTDPAVTAAAEAIHRARCCDNGHPIAWRFYIDHAVAAVAAARPIVEAEVRERIAAEIESSHEDFADPLRRFCAVCCDDDHKSLPWPCPAVRIARGMS